MQDLTFVVDAGCSAYPDMGAVTVCHLGASLESHAIFVGWIEMGKSLKVLDLLHFQSFGRHSLELYFRLTFGWRSIDAGACNIMSLGSQPDMVEMLLSALDESCIVAIDIAHEEPSTQTVAGKVGTVLLEHVLVFEQQLVCLKVAVAFFGHHVGGP